MKIHHYQTEIPKENPHGVDVRMLYDEASAQAVHIILQPGQELKPHITPVDVFFYILQGSPTVHVGEEQHQSSENELIESPKGVVHYLANNTDALCRILVVKAPKPQATTRIV